eukprot:388189-Pelagomonas_calceolata.AAC.2
MLAKNPGGVKFMHRSTEGIYSCRGSGACKDRHACSASCAPRHPIFHPAQTVQTPTAHAAQHSLRG